MYENLFCPSANGTTANATTAGTAVNIAALKPAQGLADVIWVYNTSGQPVRVRMGNAASAASFPIPAGDIQPFKIGSHTTMGLWSASTVGVELFVGDGL
jgi:hypothetical protein